MHMLLCSAKCCTATSATCNAVIVSTRLSTVAHTMHSSSNTKFCHIEATSDQKIQKNMMCMHTHNIYKSHSRFTAVLNSRRLGIQSEVKTSIGHTIAQLVRLYLLK